MTDDLEKRLRDLEKKFSDSPDPSFLNHLWSNKTFRKVLAYSGALIFGGIWALNIYTPESNQIKIERKTTISQNYNVPKRPISDLEKIDHYLSAGLARQSETLLMKGIEFAESKGLIGREVLHFYEYHKNYTSDDVRILENILIKKKIISPRNSILNNSIMNKKTSIIIGNPPKNFEGNLLKLNGEDFDFWNPLFNTKNSLSLYTLADFTGNKGDNAYFIFSSDSTELYMVVDSTDRLSKINLPLKFTISGITEFYLSKKKTLEMVKTTKEEEPSDTIGDTLSNNKYNDKNTSNTYESLDPATEMPKEFLPSESAPEQVVNKPKEDPLKIYEALNPNSEFSQETPMNHAPVVVERRDENNNIISQETKYLTREEMEESATEETGINYPSTGHYYPISREKYPKFYKKLDKNKDGKLDLEELGRYSYEFNMATKKYPEGDIEHIVKEFLKSVD